MTAMSAQLRTAVRAVLGDTHFYTDDKRTVLYRRHLDAGPYILTERSDLRQLIAPGLSFHMYEFHSDAIHHGLRERAWAHPSIRPRREVWSCNRSDFKEMVSEFARTHWKERVKNHTITRDRSGRWGVRAYFGTISNAYRDAKYLGCHITAVNSADGQERGPWIEFCQNSGDCRPTGPLEQKYASRFKPGGIHWPKTIEYDHSVPALEHDAGRRFRGADWQ